MRSLPSRVFACGNSQFVCIPSEFRVDTGRVQISRNEQGDLIIHPLRAARGEPLLSALRALAEVDDAFIAALDADMAGSLLGAEHSVL